MKSAYTGHIVVHKSVNIHTKQKQRKRGKTLVSSLHGLDFVFPFLWLTRLCRRNFETPIFEIAILQIAASLLWISGLADKKLALCEELPPTFLGVYRGMSNLVINYGFLREPATEVKRSGLLQENGGVH